jgi:uncharacterized membrane protein
VIDLGQGREGLACHCRNDNPAIGKKEKAQSYAITIIAGPVEAVIGTVGSQDGNTNLARDRALQNGESQ